MTKNSTNQHTLIKDMQILITLLVIHCSSEISFSIFKRIQNTLRSSLGENNAAVLGVLSIESDITAILDFNYVINDYSKQKARKYL